MSRATCPSQPKPAVTESPKNVTWFGFFGTELAASGKAAPRDGSAVLVGFVVLLEHAARTRPAATSTGSVLDAEILMWNSPTNARYLSRMLPQS